MTKEVVVKYSILFALILFYLIYTIRYSLVFKKNTIFSGRLKAFHFCMIWLIPFIWILLLKGFTKSTPGSHELEKKKDSDPFFDTYNLD